MMRQKHQKAEMLATVIPTRPDEPLTSAGRNAMMQRNGPSLQPVAKSSRHRKTPALHLSSAACQEEAACRPAASQAPQEPLQPDPQAQPLPENLPAPRRPLKLAPLAPEPKDTQKPAKVRGGGVAGAGTAVPPPPEPKVGVRKLEGLRGAEASSRKVKGCPVREASPSRSPERPPLCRMQPIVEFPTAAPPNQQQQPALGAKTLLLPVPQAERPRHKSLGGDLETFPSSTPPPVRSGKKPGPLSLSISPSRLPLNPLQGTQVPITKCSPPSSLECGSLAECAQGRARPRLRRIPRLEEDQGRSAPAPATAASASGLSPQVEKGEEEETKLQHLALDGGQRVERALSEPTRVPKKASRRTPAPLDGPGKASKKMVRNVVPAAVY